VISKQQEEQIISLCQDLIRQKSYSGKENSAVARLQKAFEECGYDDIYIDGYGSIVGHIKGKRKGKKILFDGHIDTVPVPDETKWHYPPFGGELIDNKIYGRGASDMKGALSAMVMSASYFAQSCSKNFAGDIYVVGGVHEECFEGVAARKISERVNPDYVVIGEASELNLKRGQRGRAEIIVETEGKSAHSANPEAGVNAVYKMAKLIQKLRDINAPEDKILGKGILELTDIKSQPYPGASVVPDYCKVTYDRRLLVGETKESVLKPIIDTIKELAGSDRQFKAKTYLAKGTETCYTEAIIAGERFFPGWLYEEEDEFVQQALSGLRNAGLEPEITQYSFCTNGSHYAGERHIKTIGFGPSRENLAHTVDEYIEVEQLLKAAVGYYGILGSVFKEG
jgi:putative selenium metabolism hydrolase